MSEWEHWTLCMSELPNPPSPPLPNAAVQHRHAEIRRGLARSNTVTVLALLIAVAFALVAVFFALQANRQAQRAEEATTRATEELWKSQVAQARALRWSDKVGRRRDGLEAIRHAVSLRPAPELRDEAIATLALMDLDPGNFWQPMPSDVETVGFSADGNCYAWWSSAGRVEVFRATDGKPVGNFTLSNRTAMSLDFSPDQRLLAARFLGGALRVWDVAERRPVFTFDAALDGFQAHSVQFHPREPWLLAAASSGRLHVVDMRTWHTAPPWDTGEAVAAMTFNRDGLHVALAGTNSIAIWDFAARRLLRSLPLDNDAETVTDLAWHPSGSPLAAAHTDGLITLLNTRSGARQKIKAHTMVITRVQFDPRGDVLVSTSWDGTTRFWDARSGRPLLTTQAGYAVAFDSAGRRLFYFKERLGVGAWDYQAATGFARLTVPIGISDRILGVDFSPDGQWLAGTTEEGVHLWHCPTREHATFVSLTNTERAAFVADGRSLVVSTRQGLYETHLTHLPGTGEVSLTEPEVLPGTEGGNFWLGFITQGGNRWFASASPTNVATVNLTPPVTLRQYPWRGPRRSAAVSPDGRFVVASAWKGGGTRIWDTHLGRHIATLGDEGGLAWFSPDGRQLAVGASTEFLFYDTGTWQCATRLKRDVVSALSGILTFSADGTCLALTHDIRQVRLLNADTKSVLAALNAPHSERITALSLSQDGKHLAAATDHREVQLWDLDRLQGELAALGLNWHQTERAVNSSREAVAKAAPAVRAPNQALWISGAGACVAGLFAFYSLRHHRRLIAAYAAVEAEAVVNQRHLKAAQDQLLHNEKMKALGTLAAGIAHDFNNLLSIIRMAGQLVQRELQPKGNAKQNLEDIEQAAVQGKNIVRSILGYSRQPGDPNQPYSVNTVVGETLAMLSKQFLSGIVLTLELAPETPAVTGDKSRLEQILLNLIVNASEAMDGTGKLKLSVRPCFDGRARILAARPAAEYVELTVQDFGPGIAPEILPRIFEPFFSTKQSGQQHGTGLGLTTVYTIAQQDGLGLDVETGVGQGAAFRVLLPVGRPPEEKT